MNYGVQNQTMIYLCSVAILDLIGRFHRLLACDDAPSNTRRAIATSVTRFNLELSERKT